MIIKRTLLACTLFISATATAAAALSSKVLITYRHIVAVVKSG